MARTGRPPVPTELKLINGNPGKRPINTAEPKYAIKVPKFPLGLSEEAEKEWRRITKLLKATRLITEADRAALAGYCVNWARWLEAEQKLQTEGVIATYVDDKGVARVGQNVYLKVSEKALAAMGKFLSEFGLTPAARVRLKTNPEDKGDELDKKMFG